MVQFYALSIFVNLVGGLILAAGDRDDGQTIFGKVQSILGGKNIKFLFGIVSAIIGFFKILTPAEGDIPVIGDLLPALSGMAIGVVLLLDFFKSSTDITTKSIESLDLIFLSNKKIIGIAGIISAVLHFLMPSVPVI